MCYENKFLKMKFRFVLVSQDLELDQLFFIQSCEGLFCPVGTKTVWSQTDGSTLGMTSIFAGPWCYLTQIQGAKDRLKVSLLGNIEIWCRQT